MMTPSHRLSHTLAIALASMCTTSLFAQTAVTPAATASPVTPQECQAGLIQLQKDVVQAAQSAGKPVDGAAMRKQLSDRAKGCLANIDTTKLDRTAMIQLGTINLIAGDSARTRLIDSCTSRRCSARFASERTDASTNAAISRVLMKLCTWSKESLGSASV